MTGSQTRCMSHNVDQHGFTTVPGVIGWDERNRLLAALGPISGAGRRGVLALPAITALARSEKLLALVRPCLAANPIPVRGIFFEKSPKTNWLVPWHQDLTLALRARVTVPGFGPWSRKEGVPHVRPPVELLEQMLSIRIHLDDADASNGALRVIPGSHRMGRLSAEQIEEVRCREREHLCVASVGDVLLMRPLLLHASGRCTGPAPRRVLHLEYASFTLPAELNWHEAA